MKRQSHVQRLRALEADLAEFEREIAELSAKLDAHRCPPHESLLRTPARRGTIFDGDPTQCPDLDCRHLRELQLLHSGTVGMVRAVKSQIVLAELHAQRGRKPGSRRQDLVRAVRAHLGPDASVKKIAHDVDLQLAAEAQQLGRPPPKPIDESTVRKILGKSGGN